MVGPTHVCTRFPVAAEEALCEATFRLVEACFVIQVCVFRLQMRGSYDPRAAHLIFHEFNESTRTARARLQVLSWSSNLQPT